MSDTVLITFGCSWTFGEGSGYKDGMSLKKYESVQSDEDICWKNGWRKIVVDHFNFEHINFSEGGSSNDRQFRLAKEFFISKKFSELYKQKNIIVLWGITVTNRYDMWCRDTNQYEKIFLNTCEQELIQFNQHKDKMAVCLKRFSHDEKSRLLNLETDIIHWNQFFKLLNIKNFWFDTFCSNNYKTRFSNFFDINNNNRDLLYQICSTHKTNLKIKDPIGKDLCFDYAKKHNLINSYSLHPKKEEYQLIAKYIIDKLEEFI